MFPRIGTMHLAAGQNRHVSLPQDRDLPEKEFSLRHLELPREVGMVLRMAGVMAIVIGGMVLAAWVAG